MKADQAPSPALADLGYTVPRVTPALTPDAIERIRKGLTEVPEVAAVWVFGSVAKGTAVPGSDVDFAVLLRERGAHRRLAPRLLGDLASRLEAAMGCQVDVVMAEAQGPMLCHEILRHGILVYEADRERRIDFESDTTSRYLDYAPTFRLAARHARQGFLDWLEKRK